MDANRVQIRSSCMEHSMRIPAAIFASVAVAASPALAQPVPVVAPSQIEILYVPPANPVLRPIYERLQARRVLEQLQLFLSPLQLPRKLAVRTEECSPDRPSYRSGDAVSICYQSIAEIEKVAPKQPYVLIGPSYLSR